MAFTLVTNQTAIARNAGALYNLEVGATNMSTYFTSAASVGIDTFLNAAYTASVGTTSTALVAAELLTNLGIPASTVAGSAGKVAQDYVVAQLNAAVYTARGAVVNKILSDFSNLTSDTVFGTYATTFNTKVTNAVTYTTVAGNADATFAAVSSTAAAVVGGTFTLTTGTNNFTGTSAADTFDAGLSTGSLQTLNAGDKLDGGAGTDELIAVITASVTPSSIANIESVSFTNTGANSVFDLSNATGITSLSSLASTAATSIQGISKTLAPTVSDTAFNHTITFNDVTGSTDSATINIKNVTGSAVITAAGVETLTLNSSGAVTNVLGVPVFAATKTLNITGTMALTTGTLATSSSLITNIDASGLVSTSNVGLNTTVAATSATTITGSAGNDTLTITTSSASDSISAGAGNDSIVFTTGFSTSDTVNGGDGSNDSLTTTFTLMSTQSAATPTTYTVTNIETLVTNTDTMTTLSYTPTNISATASTLTFAGTGAAALSAGGQTHTVVGSAGSFTLNLGASIAGNTTGIFGLDTFALSASGTATTDAITINNKAANSTTGAQLAVFATSVFGISGYETVTINGGTIGGLAQTLGTVTLAGTSGASTTLNLTGANNLTLGAVTANKIDASALTASGSVVGAGTSALQMVTGSTATTITGSAGIDNLFGNTTTASSIDAGAGSDSITGGAGNDTILGGTGNDTITSAAGNDSIDAGAGNDRVNIATALDLTENDTIVGGDGTDILAYTSLATNTATANAGVSGFETLLIDSAAANSIAMSNFVANTTFATVNFGSTSVAGVTHTVTAAPLSVTKVGFNTGLNTGNNNTVVLSRLIDNSTNSLTIVDNNTAAHVLTAATFNDEETINISGLTAAADLTVTTFNASDLVTLNVTGDADVVFTLGNAMSSTILKTVDASTSTGIVTMNAGNSVVSITATAGAGVFTFTGGFVADSITGGASADVLVGGSGNDTINGGLGSDTITGGTGADVINVGSGTDVYAITGTTDSSATGLVAGLQAGPYTLTGADVITGMAAGDIVQLSAAFGYTSTGALAANTLLAVSQGTTLVDNAYSIIRGSWAADTTVGEGVFVVNAVGADTAIIYDGDVAAAGAVAFQSIILVGTSATLTGLAAEVGASNNMQITLA